jgi:hypothetical protein
MTHNHSGCAAVAGDSLGAGGVGGGGGDPALQGAVRAAGVAEAGEVVEAG